MGVPPNVVSRFESAQHSPRLESIIAYAHALGYELKVALKKQGGVGGASKRHRNTAARPALAKKASSRRPRPPREMS